MNKRQYNIDFVLILCVLAMSVFGIIIIGSATRINVNGMQGDFTSQIMWFASGIVLMVIFTLWDYRKISKLYIGIYALNIALLILVITVGRSVHEVQRWIFGIQPSEFAKIFIIIYLAKFIDKYNKKINNIYVIFFLTLSVLLPVILIMKQPSLSASLVLLAILIVELFAGGISGRYIRNALLILIPLTVLVLFDVFKNNCRILDVFLSDYQVKRIMDYVSADFSNPDYYQTKNSIWAIGSGQLRGKGLFKGTINQLSYLPYSHNDFIFSVVGEEFGFVGCMLVLAIMLVIVSRCIHIAINAEDLLGTLIAGGVAGMLAFQTFVNIGVATGLLPNTGMPFPFLSYGGSSMWVDMIAIGLVLNVGIRKQNNIF